MSMPTIKFPVVFIVVGIVVLLYLFASGPTSPQSGVHSKKALSAFPASPFYFKWHGCVAPKLNEIVDAQAFWNQFKGIADKCDLEANISALPIIKLRNKDEDKFALLPVKSAPKSENVLITLGVGVDIKAEEALKVKMNEIGQNITFYGADPISVENADLYSTIGKYFPFAVGSNAGYADALVFIKENYITKNVVYVDIIYFLDKMLKIKIIDHLWFDAEGAEYDLFDIFYKDGRFDENGIMFCQMSLEVHTPNLQKKEKFMAFIKQLLKDQRFGFFYNFYVGHMRMWLMNFESSYCRQKFLQPGV